MESSPSEVYPSPIPHHHPPPHPIDTTSPDNNAPSSPRNPLSPCMKESPLTLYPNKRFLHTENQIIQSNKELHQAKGGLEHQHSSGEEVDLAAIMKSLQIEIPEEIEVGYQGEEAHKQEVNSPFKLLIKVASSSGTPRNIPVKALNNAMSSAWRDKYWFIDQIKPALYIAYFKSEEAMDFVIKKQPWSVESDNLLLEWINPDDEDRDVEEYQFRYIYVPIKVFGVPGKFRSPDLMKFVIDKSAQPSDLHPPPDISMVSRKDYIQAYAKMDISKPVKDKVKYFVSPKDHILFYINYDKVKRICTFCGMMFHTVQNCPNRGKLIRYLQSIKANTADVPFVNIGIWTSQAWKIPDEALQQSSMLGKEIKMVSADNTSQLSAAKLKNSNELSTHKFGSGRTDLSTKQSSFQSNPVQNVQLEMDITSQAVEDIISKKQEIGYHCSFQKQKRQAESDPEPMEEDGENHRHSRIKINHISQEFLPEASKCTSPVTNQDRVYWPSSSHTLQAVTINDKMQSSASTHDQIQHNNLQNSISVYDQIQQSSLTFNEGKLSSHTPVRKKFRPQKKSCSLERVKQVKIPTKQLFSDRSQIGNLSCPNMDDHLNWTVKEIAQGSNHYHRALEISHGTSFFTGEKETAEELEQAAAPAFKAPRAQ